MICPPISDQGIEFLSLDNKGEAETPKRRAVKRPVADLSHDNGILKDVEKS
jgi:hypothetical protein